MSAEPVDLPAAVMDRFRAPGHGGRPQDPAGWRHGRGGALKTGALIDLWLRVEDGQIARARFAAFGCPSTIASAQWLCERIEGAALAGPSIDGLAIATALSLPAAKRGVALVAEDALRDALKNTEC